MSRVLTKTLEWYILYWYREQARSASSCGVQYGKLRCNLSCFFCFLIFSFWEPYLAELTLLKLAYITGLVAGICTATHCGLQRYRGKSDWVSEAFVYLERNPCLGSQFVYLLPLLLWYIKLCWKYAFHFLFSLSFYLWVSNILIQSACWYSNKPIWSLVW